MSELLNKLKMSLTLTGMLKTTKGTMEVMITEVSEENGILKYFTTEALLKYIAAKKKSPVDEKEVKEIEEDKKSYAVINLAQTLDFQTMDELNAADVQSKEERTMS